MTFMLRKAEGLCDCCLLHQLMLSWDRIVMGAPVTFLDLYVEFLTSSTSECDCVGDIVIKRKVSYSEDIVMGPKPT